MPSTYSVLGPIGANFAERTLQPKFAVGTAAVGNENDTWVYVKASEEVATGTCTVGAAPTFLLTDAAGNYTADVAFAINEYGWVKKTTSPL